MRKIFALFIVHCSLFIVSVAHAVCPVCTVAVGAGLEGARLLGVDDVITGVWSGGFTLLLFFWTVKFLKRRNVDGALWYVAAFALWVGLIALLYLTPKLTFGANTLWGIDRFMLGAITGAMALYAAERWNHGSIRANGGKSRFKFQKVIVPFGALLTLSALFAAVIYI